MTLQVEGIRHRFTDADTPLFDGVSFTIDEGEITCMVGPSGIGKSTLLHIIAGLVHPDGGSVSLDGTALDDVPTHRRPFTLLMQQPQLFAHLDVRDNVAFGLRVRGVRRKERADSAQAWLELVGIGHLARRAVGNLSGGEQQRVALARALAVEPRVLLADEPFASVDATARRELQTLLLDLHHTLGTTILLVTHDEAEARRLATLTLTIAAGGRTQTSARSRGSSLDHSDVVPGAIGDVPPTTSSTPIAISGSGRLVERVPNTWQRSSPSVAEVHVAPRCSSARR